MKNVFRSTGVVLLAFIACALLSILTDFLLESIGVLPDPSQGLHETGLIILVLVYRAIYTVFSGYLVGWLAPHKPMLHILVVGLIGIVLTLLALTDPEFSEKAPHWYVYVLAAQTLPTLWLGVKIQAAWKDQGN